MERFPEINCTGNVFEIDRKRYTCAGGTTSIDLMLEIVRSRFRPEPRQCGRQPVPARAHPLGRRPPAGRARARPHRQVGKAAQDRRADGRQSRRALFGSRACQVCRACRCGRSSGCSCAISAMTPGRYYMRLRLERARELLAPDQHADPRRGDRHRLHLAFLFRAELPAAVRPSALGRAPHDLLNGAERFSRRRLRLGRRAWPARGSRQKAHGRSRSCSLKGRSAAPAAF